MEARKITIVSTKTQNKKVIMSTAKTLAELKSDLTTNGIDYSGMTFYEGTSKTELKTDESVLPTNVPYKGTITNELVFMLTNSEKKIKSGAMTRAEAYATIKKMGLQNACVKKFGKNFTMCRTADLITLIESSVSKTVKTINKKVKDAPANIEEKAPKEIVDIAPTENAKNDVKMAMIKLVSALAGTTISYEVANNILNEISTSITPAESNYSDEEIDEMFEDID